MAKLRLSWMEPTARRRVYEALYAWAFPQLRGLASEVDSRTSTYSVRLARASTSRCRRNDTSVAVTASAPHRPKTTATSLPGVVSESEVARTIEPEKWSHCR